MKIVPPNMWNICCPEYDLLEIIQDIDEDFHPSISSQQDLVSYANKLKTRAHIFLAENNGELMGILAAYLNANKETYVSLITVISKWRKKGIAKDLLLLLQNKVQRINGKLISCRVSVKNNAARGLYKKVGFVEKGNFFHINNIEKVKVFWFNSEHI